MSNNIWNSLVTKVDDKLEAAMTVMNNHLNDSITTLDTRVDKLEDKSHTIHNCFEDVRVTVNN